MAKVFGVCLSHFVTSLCLSSEEATHDDEHHPFVNWLLALSSVPHLSLRRVWYYRVYELRVQSVADVLDEESVEVFQLRILLSCIECCIV